MPLVKIYNRTEFDAEHGEFVPANDGSHDDIYRDGARWSRRYEAYVDPPIDADERREAEREFLAVKLHRLKAAYTSLRKDVIESLGYAELGLGVPGPDDRDFNALKKMVGLIRSAENELRDVPLNPAEGLAASIARAKDRDRRERNSSARHQISELPRF